MIVLKKDVTSLELKKIKDLQIYIAKKYPRFGTDGVEMIFVSLYTINNYRRRKTFLTAVAPGNPLETIICKPEFLIYFYIVRNHGKTIMGYPKEKVFPKISKNEFVSTSNNVAVKNISYWEESCKKTSHEQFYCVTTLCRALYIKRNKTYPSKLESKNWAKNNYPIFKDVIEYAWELRGKWTPKDKPLNELKYKEIINFCEFARKELSQ